MGHGLIARSWRSYVCRRDSCLGRRPLRRCRDRHERRRQHVERELPGVLDWWRRV